MSSVNVTYGSFVISFPELQSFDANRVIQLIDQVQCETNCYDLLYKPALQELAIKLHVAHMVKLYEMSELNVGFGGAGQRVQKLKSKHDEIQWSFDANNPFNYNQTSYGARLAALLERNHAGLNINWCC